MQPVARYYAPLNDAYHPLSRPDPQLHRLVSRDCRVQSLLYEGIARCAMLERHRFMGDGAGEAKRAFLQT
jgi:hypothetical protein